MEVWGLLFAVLKVLLCHSCCICFCVCVCGCVFVFGFWVGFVVQCAFSSPTRVLGGMHVVLSILWGKRMGAAFLGTSCLDHLDFSPWLCKSDRPHLASTVTNPTICSIIVVLFPVFFFFFFNDFIIGHLFRGRGQLEKKCLRFERVGVEAPGKLGSLVGANNSCRWRDPPTACVKQGS